MTKGGFPDEILRILLSYHTTPQSTTKETTFNLEYGIDALIHIKTVDPTFRVTNFSPRASKDVWVNLYLIDDVRECKRI